MYGYEKSSYKKMVTTGVYVHKKDIGIAETIRWLSTEHSHPNIYGESKEFFVIMPDGEVKKLWYGDGRDLVCDFVTDEDCLEISFAYDENKSLLESDELKEFSINFHGWYEIEEWDDFSIYGDYEGTRHRYLIYGESPSIESTTPKYYLDNSIGQIPTKETFEEEYWEYSHDSCLYELKDSPCPFAYKEEKGE